MATIYVLVTADELELPIAVSESLSDLSKMYNIPRQTLYNAISEKRVIKALDARLIKVDVEA